MSVNNLRVANHESISLYVGFDEICGTNIFYSVSNYKKIILASLKSSLLTIMFTNIIDYACCGLIPINTAMKIIVFMEIINFMLTAMMSGFYFGANVKEDDPIIIAPLIAGLAATYCAIINCVSFICGLVAVYMNKNGLLFWFLILNIAWSVIWTLYISCIAYDLWTYPTDADEIPDEYSWLFFIWMPLIVLLFHVYCHFVIYRFIKLNSNTSENAQIRFEDDQYCGCLSIDVALQLFITWEFVMFIVSVSKVCLNFDTDLYNAIVWLLCAVCYGPSFFCGLMGVFMKRKAFLFWFDIISILVTIISIFVFTGYITIWIYLHYVTDILFWIVCIVIPIGYNAIRIYCNIMVQRYRELTERSTNPVVSNMINISKFF
eukprot:232245_1